MDDTTFVVRSVGERTERVCYSLLASQAPPSSIRWLRDMPYLDALREFYETGIKENRKWTVVVDADFLLRDNAIERIHRLAEQAHRNLFQIQGRCISKFTLEPIGGGIRIYRTEYFPHAVRALEKCRRELRPETAVARELALNGFASNHVSDVFNVHDFEQYYIDIFRKSFAFARRFASRIPTLLALWRPLSREDPDYLVALWGLSAGVAHTGELDLSKSGMFDEMYAKYNDGRIQEKGEYSDVDAARRLVSETVEHHAGLRSVLPKTRVQKLWGRLDKNGPFRSGLYYLGTFATIAGNWLARVAESGDSE